MSNNFTVKPGTRPSPEGKDLRLKKGKVVDSLKSIKMHWSCKSA
jgi:hypothetical protein